MRGSPSLCSGWPKPGSGVRLLAVLAHELHRVGAGRQRVAQHRPGVLGGAEDHRAAAEQPGGDRALQRLGRRGERHPRGLHARHEAVLGDRHEAGVGHAPLALVRSAAHQEEEEHLGQGQVPHQLRGEVVSADVHRVRGRLRDRRLGIGHASHGAGSRRRAAPQTAAVAGPMQPAAGARERGERRVLN